MNKKEKERFVTALISLIVTVFLLIGIEKFALSMFSEMIPLPPWGFAAFCFFTSMIMATIVEIAVRKAGISGVDSETGEAVTVHVGKAKWLTPILIVLLLAGFALLPPALTLISNKPLALLYLSELYYAIYSVTALSGIITGSGVISWILYQIMTR